LQFVYSSERKAEFSTDLGGTKKSEERNRTMKRKKNDDAGVAGPPKKKVKFTKTAEVKLVTENPAAYMYYFFGYYHIFKASHYDVFHLSKEKVMDYFYFRSFCCES